MAIGCYPGSFDPPTVAHLAIAEAAHRQAGLHRVVLVVSRRALGKEHLDDRSVTERAAALEEFTTTRPWLEVTTTDAQLIAEVAAGYDAVIVGADKWRQILDPAWYASPAARDAALAALPRVLVAPRGDDRPEGVELLEVDDAHRHVSSSAIREGHPDAERWRAQATEPGG